MRGLVILALLAVVMLVGYNYGAGRDLLQLPGTEIEKTVRDTVGGAVRDTVKSTVGDTSATAGVTTAVHRAQETVAAAAITSKIKAKMALDDLVKASDIDVDTRGSEVTLTGAVESAEARRRAVRLAKETAGVTKVVDHLKIR